MASTACSQAPEPVTKKSSTSGPRCDEQAGVERARVVVGLGAGRVQVGVADQLEPASGAAKGGSDCPAGTPAVPGRAR